MESPIAAMPQASAVPERRRLIAILATVEGILMLGPIFISSSFGVQPVDVGQGPGCAQPGGSLSAGVATTSGSASCGNDPTSQALTLLAVLAVLLAIMVLPVLIGLLSRRWQTAIAAPTIPVWVLTTVVAILTVLSRLNESGGSIGFGGPFGGYNTVFSLLFATPLVVMILFAGIVGGLAWLVRRGFAR